MEVNIISLDHTGLKNVLSDNTDSIIRKKVTHTELAENLKQNNHSKPWEAVWYWLVASAATGKLC